MTKVSIFQILIAKPCLSGLIKLVKYLGLKSLLIFRKFPSSDILYSNGIEDSLWVMRNVLLKNTEATKFWHMYKRKDISKCEVVVKMADYLDGIS